MSIQTGRQPPTGPATRPGDSVGGEPDPAADPRRVHTVRIEALVLDTTPRSCGLDVEHARLLAESGADLPPLLVHQRSMRVIDGVHRLHAAILLGRQTVDVRYFDGTDDDAFVEAVRANIAHGLPLSLADREAAAARIITTHGYWSDRAIAAVSGLAPRTVGKIRRRMGVSEGQTTRLGRDGRMRPLDSSEARRVAGELIQQRPGASLREIAREAGLSPATVRAVRELMGDRERAPSAEPLRTSGGPVGGPVGEIFRMDRPRRHTGMARPPDKAETLRNLTKDPSLRLTQSGRAMLRWLSSRAAGPGGWSHFSDAVPPHCLYTLANVARACAQEWIEFADELEQQARESA